MFTAGPKLSLGPVGLRLLLDNGTAKFRPMIPEMRVESPPQCHFEDANAAKKRNPGPTPYRTFLSTIDLEEKTAPRSAVTGP